MRALFLRLLFVIGMLVAFVFLTIPIFLRSFFRKARAFHPSGTVCTAKITPIDDAGKPLAGTARVRFASATADENSPEPSIIGMSIKIGDDQDLALATFESFTKAGDATKASNVADYLVANQYASVAPWLVRGLGVTWLRALPDPAASTDKTGTRVERLRADIDAKRASLVLEARAAPGPDAEVHAKLATIVLTGIEPQDDPNHHISMFRHGRGVTATGFRNGVRSIVYPVSQFARGLRGR